MPYLKVRNFQPLFFVLATSLLLSALTSHASYRAVVSGERIKLSHDRNYSLHFLERDQLQSEESISLGRSQSQPILFPGVTAERLWVALRRDDTSAWDIIGYDTGSRQELARLSIGKHVFREPCPHHFRAIESADGKYLHVLLRKKGTVLWVSTFDIDTSELVSSIKLGKGRAELRQLPNKLLLVELRKWNAIQASRLFVLDPHKGAAIVDLKNLRGTAERYRLSKQGHHLYLLEHRPVSEVAKRAGERRIEKIEGTTTTIEVLRTLDGERILQARLGHNLPELFDVDGNDALYGVTQNGLAAGGYKIWKLDEGNLTTIHEGGHYCEPASLVTSEERDLVSVFCASGILHGSLSGKQDLAFAKFSFDGGTGIYAPSNNAVYALSTKGQRVIKVTTSPLEFVAKRSVGRAGVKFGQGLMAAGGIALGLTTGYGFVAMPNWYLGGTQIAQHPVDSSRLYALNRGTRDITVFDGAGFERTAALPVRSAPIGLVAFPRQQVPWVFSFATEQVLAFDLGSVAPVLRLEGGRFLSVDAESDRLYYQTSAGLQIRSLLTLEVVANLSALNEAVSVVTVHGGADQG